MHEEYINKTKKRYSANVAVNKKKINVENCYVDGIGIRI